MANRTRVTFHATEGMFSFPLPYSGCLGPGESAVLADDEATILANLGSPKSQVVTLTTEPSGTDLTSHAALPSGLPVPTEDGMPASKAYVDDTIVVGGASAGGDLSGTYPNPRLATSVAGVNLTYNTTSHAINLDSGFQAYLVGTVASSASAVTLTGSIVGETVQAVLDFGFNTTSSTVTIANISDDFESTISVVNQIQQTGTAGSTAGDKFLAVLKKAT